MHEEYSSNKAWFSHRNKCWASFAIVERDSKLLQRSFRIHHTNTFETPKVNLRWTQGSWKTCFKITAFFPTRTYSPSQRVKKGGNFETRKFFDYSESFFYCLYSRMYIYFSLMYDLKMLKRSFLICCAAMLFILFKKSFEGFTLH